MAPRSCGARCGCVAGQSSARCPSSCGRARSCPLPRWCSTQMPSLAVRWRSRFMAADGSFELVEDDGATTAYESGAVRTTSLKWDDARRTLSWTTSGAAAGPQAFLELFVTLLEPRGLQRSTVQSLGTGGSISLEAPAKRKAAFLSPEGGASFGSPAKPHVQQQQ
mmetsp:Transcript_21126/g.66072  ORF Transcript_21126/g.66072 Transcript_21126/m.66072 type:complete len:165 (-) Transcript_21126:98-592(-)